MSCKKIKKRIHLYRSGELSNREKSQLQLHLSGCQKCREDLHKTLYFDSWTAQMRENPVYPEQPDKLVQQIIHSIKGSENLSGSRGGFLFSQLKIVVLVLGIVFLGGLVIEGGLLLKRISDLEAQISSMSKKTENLSPIWLKNVFKENILNIMMSSDSIWRERPGDKIVLDKTFLNQLTHFIRSLSLIKQNQLRETFQSYPGLEELFLGREIEKNDFLSLLEKRGDILGIITKI